MKKRLMSLVLILAMAMTLCVGMALTANAEDAVPASSVYHDGVRYCIDHGIMRGYGNSFHRDGVATRQQVWMMLARISGETPADMAAARAWAMENGVSDGTNPTKAVTRQQFITMLYRYAVDQGYDVSVGEDTNILSYEDAFDISEYAIPAVQWGCGSGIMGGYADGYLKPFETATRAHMAAFLQRFCVGA